MKVLTVTQPWATLIAIGAKQIETRSWGTPYRGAVAIHAGKGLDPIGGVNGLLEVCASEPFATVLAAHRIRPGELPRGAIVCAGYLRACEQMTQRLIDGLSAQEAAFGHYAPGRYAWRLTSVKPLARPLPVRGRLGLNDLPPDSAADVERLAREYARTANARALGVHLPPDRHAGAAA